MTIRFVLPSLLEFLPSRAIARKTFLSGTCALTLFAASPISTPQTVEASGSVKFIATTNVSAISIHGQSSELRTHASVTHENGQLVLESLDARVSPSSLSTGMALRDHHMREKIFSTGAGAAPELQFQTSKATCPEPAKGKESICQLSGSFSMRGTSKPFALPMRIKADGARYRITAEGSVKLTDYGVERPCQLGVCVDDAVKIKIEVQAEERQTVSKAGSNPAERH